MSVPKEFVYQGYIREKIERVGKTAVIAPPGSGKTRPIIESIENSGILDLRGRVLVVCSGPAVATWTWQFPHWSRRPQLSERIFQSVGPKERRMAALAEVKRSGGIIITNAACFRQDFAHIQSMGWDVVVADEYHKYMRSKKSETYIKFLKLTRHMKYVVIATGSLMARHPPSMFTAFQIVKPTVFKGYWKFANTYCIWQETSFGKDFVGIKNLDSLHKIMDRYLAFVPKEVVADEQPEGRRLAIEAQMTLEQSRIYQDLSDDMLAGTESGGLILAANAMAMYVKLRQLLCCPRILDESLGMGGGFELLLDKLEETPHAAIFVPFRPAVLYIAEALEAKGYDVVWLRGGVKAEEQMERVERFRNGAGVIVCTIAYAESFDLETCATSYFLGYDYSLDQNEQAEGRTKRVISEHEFVTWNYIKYLGTIDEILLEKLNEDMRNVRKVLGRPQAMIDALKGYTN